ncbi:MAG: nucleoside deaminase [Chitinophagales bacterium]|nr:nucleoside deaminase [Chitinophagales bacterium]MCB9019770.1 nucleoside deaminase [Chitinophagales bacterium]MCB9032028.1 nucleoside deaminase [Chitinophagales bacterium]HAE12727.1 tRNA-specific adenosine deaminase [Bacteroidota bacterium]HPR30005.1 nucleoside deaminase [Chitinophagales bacterium]
MGILTDPDSYFMQQAIRLAEQALEQDEVPVGAVVVSNGHIIARAHNLVERLHDPTAHAEMQAITAACNHFGSKYLTECTLYVTLEPCTMCATAIYWAQVGRLVYGASDPKLGFSRHQHIMHPKTQILGGIEEDTCGQLLKDFFKGKR